MADIQFDGIIESARGGGACIPVPFDPKEVFGTGRSVRVVATYDGFEAKSNVVSMDGRAVLGIHKATREAIQKHPGDAVSVSLKADDAPRPVDVPSELTLQLLQHPDVGARFNALAFTHRREFSEWVAEAKKPETRNWRAAKTIEMVKNGQTR